MRPRTIAIGDIHGCSRALAALLAAIGPRPEDVIVTLGDYVNRGPDSRGVIDRLLALEDQCILVPILGNHDQTLLSALKGERHGLSDLLDMGGRATLTSYGAGRITEADLGRIPAEHIAFLRRCRDFYETETHIFVHAQYDPDLAMEAQSPLWLRWESLRDGIPDPHDSGKRVIVGHSSQKSGEILDLGHLVCIDTFCFGGGWLTALDVRTDEVWQANRRVSCGEQVPGSVSPHSRFSPSPLRSRIPSQYHPSSTPSYTLHPSTTRSNLSVSLRRTSRDGATIIHESGDNRGKGTMARGYRKWSTLVAIATGMALIPIGARALDTVDTRLLSTPAITEGKIAFAYADDIWVADADGSNPRRLTSHPGEEQNPYFSPDGKHIAFTASYDGNDDVYVIPTEGGEPSRLTWHSGEDIVRGFTPDGKVLFSSQRGVFSRRLAQFYTVGVAGGVPDRLPIPTAFKVALSPDGKYLAYTPLGESFRQWKNYRGGTASRIWVLKLDDLSHEEVPKPAGGCNDTEPMWIGETVYFLSDRDGEFNLYAYDRGSRTVTRCTHHDAFPIAGASAGAGKVIYEQAGWIHRFDPKDRRSHRLKIGVGADLAETRPRYASDAKHVRNLGISPSGKRAVLEYRGEIVTIPAKKGDPHVLTGTPGAHERSPAWSPDGKSIAYFSDATGEYQLVVRPQDGKGEGRSYPIKGSGFYDRPVWSPDSKKIAFIDNARTLSWIDLATGAVKRIAAEPIYGPGRASRTNYAWSPDSKWLAYSLINRAGFQAIWLHAIDSDKSHPVTDGLAEAGEPVFDHGGKYLYFLASTDAGPANNWFDQSFTDVQATRSVYLVTLARATANPLLKESDEEGATEPEKAPKIPKLKSLKKIQPLKDENDLEGNQKILEENDKILEDNRKIIEENEEQLKDHDKAKDHPAVVIDLDGIAGRAMALPVEAGHLQHLTAGADGHLYYIRRVGVRPGQGPAARGKPALKRFDLKTREEEQLAEGIDEFQLSADRKKVLYEAGGPPPPGAPLVLGIVDAGKFNKGDGALKLDAISVRVDPRAEWAQMFHEAWRINRDYFYAPNMHGADWDAMRRKYEALLPHLASRDDLDRVIRMMLSELSVGHSFLGGGERLYEPKPIPVGLLGADYEVADGRFRIQTIYGGAFWDPSLRAPLTAPGVDVKPGDFLLAVDGKEVKADTEVYRSFEATAGKRVELKVGPKADGSGARTVVVEPIADEGALRNRAWVEGNLRKVHERTKGRVAYVYVPNTAGSGYEYFKRYFFPQADKEAIIVDERFNGGGQVADYYIELLRRPLVSYWATRYGETLRSPNAVILGPKVMIIDETAGSGGDLLPWMFRKFGLGKLVGKKTWGGLVGILGFPNLMDGGAVAAPDLAIFTEEGWVVENVGVPPDIDVEQDPAAVAAGKDPQLDKAIEVVLKELAENPPPKPPARPPFPVRVRTPGRDAAAR